MRAVLVSLVASLSLLLGACSSSSPPSPDNKVAKTQGQAEAKAGAEGAKALPAPKPLPKPKALPAPQAVGNSGSADARGGNAAGGPGTNTAPPGPEILGGPDLANMSYKVSVEATFKGLPAGAYIVAPSARDRRYQKVTKSAHSGVPGAVTASEDGENLFFVSEPTKAGDASYVGTFEINRRVGTEGGIDRAKGKDFATGKGAVKAGSDDGAMAKAAAELGPKDMKPFAALVAAMNKAAAKGGGAGYAVADEAATLMRQRGVPATLIGGYLAPKAGAAATRTHSWVLAELPSVGLTPMDPTLRAGNGAWKEGDDPANMGQIDAERIEMVSGDELVIAAQDGTNPRIELNGDITAPRAIKDGKVVGEVTWKVRFEKLPEAKK